MLIRQTRRPTASGDTCPDEVVRGPLPDIHRPESASVSSSSGGHLMIGARLGPARRDVSARRNEMHPEELMKPDLFSEIVLLGSGGLIFVSLLLIVAAALT